MTFSTLLPLGLLVLVPFIIILYFLRPRGRDTRISSNLLWKQLFEKTSSRTKKSNFVKDILLLLQILAVLLLIFAMTAPFIRSGSVHDGNVLILLDNSAGMLHKDGKETRLEKAVEDAVNLVEDSRDASFTVISTGGSTDIRISNSKDHSRVIKVLRDIEATDEAGNLEDAFEIVRTMQQSGGDELLHVIVFTDGSGALGAGEFKDKLDAEIRVYGGGSSNVALGKLTFSASSAGTVEEPLYNLAAVVNNYSDSTASFEVTLLDEDGAVLGISNLKCDAGLSATAMFKDVNWKGNSVRAELSGISFAGGGADSLEKDNKAYAIKDKKTEISGMLIGQGNIYIEKAFLAITKHNLLLSADDSSASKRDINILIYDAGTKKTVTPDKNVSGILRFGIPADEAETENSLEGVLLNVRNTALTSGISEFTLGVNKAAELKVPEWAESFIEHNGNSVGYYGENEGVRYIVLGFDIRESDFPLNAEFPIFMSNAISYLSDSGILIENDYTAGDTLLVNPSADYDAALLGSRLTEAGVFTVSVEGSSEKFVVRFPLSESDGRPVSEGTVSTGNYKGGRVRRNISSFLLIAAVIIILTELAIYVWTMRYRGRFYFILRAAVVLLIIAALFKPFIPVKAMRQTTIFLVDGSLSNSENIEEISIYISKETAKMGKDDQYGVAVFGRQSVIDQFVTKDSNYAGIMTEADTSATNIEEAVSRALSMIPSESAGRIVILTDGKETEGNIMNTASALVGGDVELLSILFEEEEKNDAYIENATLPDNVSVGEIFSINTTIVSNIDAPAEIILEDDKGNIYKNNIDLKKGSNRFTFKQSVDSSTSGSYRLTIKAEGDENPDNDCFNVFTAVSDAPEVLVVFGNGRTDSAFEKTLHAAGINYESINASKAPDSLKTMLAYESIIFDDVFLNDVPKGFLDNLEEYVKDYGHGFICCGGESSFMLGGYRDTVVEKVLPVDMSMRGLVEYPSTALVMVIDRSGSMLERASGSSGATYLDVALNAAILAVENLSPSDYVGVITFDDSYEWAVPVQRAENRDEIINAIKKINEGGGTTIKPALIEAANETGKVNAVNKHMLLLTDGMGETTDFKDAVKLINDNKITLSTVAVGMYSDVQLLNSLAKACGGRYYFSSGSGDVPKIFTREIYLSMNKYIQNGDFVLNVSASNAITRGLFTGGWPNLLGYVASTPKDMATSVITSNLDDPILTVWQYGLGKTVAWNSDVSGAWSGNYSGESDYAAMWKRIVDYTINENMSSADSVEMKNENGRTAVIYKSNDYKNETVISADYSGPEGVSGKLEFSMVEPGLYKAYLPESDAGIYALNVIREDEGKVVNAINTAAVLQYPKEYRFDISNKNYKDYVEKYGRSINMKENIWKSMKKHYKDSFDLTWLMILLALLLFTADITLRKLGFMYFPRRKKTAEAGGKAYVRDSAGAISGSDMSKTVSAAGSLSDMNKLDSMAGLSSGMNIRESVSDNKSFKKEKKEKKNKKDVPQSNLDMSTLLKKKNDRNMN